MDNKYINIYNNLVNLTRNKRLYDGFISQDTFSDRLIFLLFHFSFFLKINKKKCSKKILQEIFDYFFKQLELSIREIGYGDVAINKKMKEYINIFYSMLDELESWENLNICNQEKIFNKYLNTSKNNGYLVNYFKNYIDYLQNNTFNSLLKGVIKHNF